MTTYEFTITIKDLPEVTDDIANQLYEAGCDGGLVRSCDGVTEVNFMREAEQLTEAIESTMQEIRSAGFEIDKIETEEASAINRLNQQLQLSK